MRVFAAIPLPEEVVDDLRGQLADVTDDPLRWTDPSSWHLTLSFFGSLPDDAVDDLRRRLRRTAGRSSTLDLALSGAGHFGRRVVWAGVAGDVDRLRKLARSVTAAGRRAGADVDDQARYRPHLTLARAPSPHQDRDQVASAVTEAVQRFRDYAGPTWTAEAFTLVRSDPGKGAGGRARHTVIETFPLTG